MENVDRELVKRFLDDVFKGEYIVSFYSIGKGLVINFRTKNNLINEGLLIKVLSLCGVLKLAISSVNVNDTIATFELLKNEEEEE
ncbi:MAG: hypothetical protein QXL94_08200 [Candidatus Parvarchaeum sp.]